jgi:hypothetical protein
MGGSNRVRKKYCKGCYKKKMERKMEKIRFTCNQLLWWLCWLHCCLDCYNTVYYKYRHCFEIWV